MSETRTVDAPRCPKCGSNSYRVLATLAGGLQVRCNGICGGVEYVIADRPTPDRAPASRERGASEPTITLTMADYVARKGAALAIREEVDALREVLQELHDAAQELSARYVGGSPAMDRLSVAAMRAGRLLRAALSGAPTPGVTIVADPSTPPGELHLRDAQGRTVGKIVGLGAPTPGPREDANG